MRGAVGDLGASTISVTGSRAGRFDGLVSTAKAA
jgi:hypothetical protein